MTILLQASLSFMMLFNSIFVKPVSSRMTVLSVVEGLPVFLFESGDHINSCEAGSSRRATWPARASRRLRIVVEMGGMFP